MGNNFKKKHIHFLMILTIILTSLSYGNDDAEAKLWQAAKTDNFCRMIMFKGMNADIYNEYGQTPIMVAAQQSNSRFIDCLREAQVDVLLKDNDGKTAFYYIKKPKTQMEEMYSIRTYNALRRLEVYQMIGDKARIVQEDINLKKRRYKLWIEGALCEEFPIPDDIECIEKEKIDRSGSRYEIYTKDVKRGVPLIFAAIQNNLHDTLEDLLHEGADIELKNKFETTPLGFAIYQNDDKLVKILLKNAANPNVIDGNGLYSPLSEACVTNRISTVKLLLKYGADVNYQYNKSETALTVAAKECKNFELVKLLLGHGADPKLMDSFGHNTLTGLRRYCRDIVTYRKMQKFIEWNSL